MLPFLGKARVVEVGSAAASVRNRISRRASFMSPSRWKRGPLKPAKKRVRRAARRAFVAVLCGAAAWPVVARAQQPRQVRRVGVVMSGAENDSQLMKQVSAFREGMRKLGWVEGKNLALEVRWQAAGPEAAQVVITELITLSLDVILVGTIQAFLALRRSSSNIPVVFVNLPDPVATGLVGNIAKTNSNFTGFTAYEYSITGKWLQILKEIAPDVNRVGFIFGTAIAPVGDNFYCSLEAEAPSFGVTTIPIRFSDALALDAELKAFGSEPKSGAPDRRRRRHLC